MIASYDFLEADFDNDLRDLDETRDQDQEVPPNPYPLAHTPQHLPSSPYLLAPNPCLLTNTL
jgi:hypothetical protein